MCLELFYFRCDELKIKIHYLLVEHVFVNKAASIIYLDKSSELGKSLLESVYVFDLFYLQGAYRIYKRFSTANIVLGIVRWENENDYGTDQ